MSMEKINGSSVLRQGSLDSAKHNERIADQKKADQTQSMVPGQAPGLPGDTAVISDTAHRLMEMRQAMEVGYAALAALPDMRQDKIDGARQRLAEGHSDPTQVRDKVASGVDKVIKGMEAL